MFDQVIETFLNQSKKEGRSSPAGMYWNDFFTFLKKFKQSSEPDPPVPLILAASCESDASKYSRLKNSYNGLWIIIVLTRQLSS